jgi:small ligand-binding sensory domain FIST
MIRAGVGLSTAREPRSAAAEAARAALAGADRADAALLFATPGFAGMRELLEAAVSCLGTPAVVGASAQGVMAGGVDCEDRPAVAILALSGLEAVPFLLGELSGDEGSAGEEIAARLGEPRPEDLVVLLPDPGSIRPEPLIRGVTESLGPACVVGAGAVDPLSATPLQWCGGRIETGALAGMVLRAPRSARVGVTQACRPVSDLLTVTRTQGNWLLELDGRPALDVYREVARAPLAADLRRAAAFLLVALPRDADEPLRPGGYLVRHVIGFAPEQRAFAIPETPKPGQRLALALRDAESARLDMKAMLEGIGSDAPACGLYFDCCARGASFFGVPGLEAAYLDQAFGPRPVAGMFGSCEIGPIGGATELLTYTGVLALLDESR